MWYFSRILGLGLASACAILIAMWLELDADRQAPVLPGTALVGNSRIHSAHTRVPKP